jgi:phosphomannomutase
MNPQAFNAFRRGDVRGIFPTDIDEAFAYRFAQAFARRFQPAHTVATGRDMRDSSGALQEALNRGFCDSGLGVVDLGLCTTELGYFASSRAGIDAAVIVTASHNPARYNGFKCVLGDGEAVTYDTGLADVMALMVANETTGTTTPGSVAACDMQPEYTRFLKERFSPGSFGGKIALNGLNGTAATLAGRIADQFSLPVTWFRKEPGPIPVEGADPANPRLVAEMKSFMKDGGFRLGVAWDGDCDRCVFFDGEGNLVPTYYLVGLFAEHFLRRHPGRAVVFDTKLCWNTLEIIARCGGKPVPSETGHAFVKHNMRKHNAIYGGELSSHHFFGDFFYCDSGMFSWLTLLEIIERSGMDVGELVAESRTRFCSTPEISLELADTDKTLRDIYDAYRSSAVAVNHFDGLGVEMPGGWRFSLTPSKTEPLMRVNIESRAGAQQLLTEGAHLLKRLEPYLTHNVDLLAKLVVQ